MKKMHHYIFSLVTLFLITLLPFGELKGQSSLPLPPTNQKTPYYSIPAFNRQPEPKAYIRKGIRNLEKVSRSKWTGVDSLFYAFELTYLGDYEKALAYFNKVNTDTLNTINSLSLYQLSVRKTKRFNKLIKSLNNEMELFPENSTILKARIELANARKLQNEEFLRIANMTVFPTLLDSLQFHQLSKKELAHIANNYEQALRREVLYTDENDKLLSKAYEEFGDFLHRYLYVSNAYIAYSISRNFDRRNNATSRKIKQTKDELNKNNYLYPSLFNFFKRIDRDKYDFKVYQELDSLEIVILQKGRYPELDELLAKSDIRKDHLPWLDGDLAIIVSLLILLIIVIVVIRAKREKTN